jgi:hypothetical protein
MRLRCANSISIFLRSQPEGRPSHELAVSVIHQRAGGGQWLTTRAEVDVALMVVGEVLAIVTLKNRTLSPVVERFIKCVHDVAKSVSERPKTSGR